MVLIVYTYVKQDNNESKNKQRYGHHYKTDKFSIKNINFIEDFDDFQEPLIVGISIFYIMVVIGFFK
jgi:hypothetical protein